MVETMSAFDAHHLVQDNPDRDYQLAKLMNAQEGHEFDLGLENPEPGEPCSPVIESTELSPSHMFVEFHFKGTPVFVSSPAMSTVTIGWLENDNA